MSAKQNERVKTKYAFYINTPYLRDSRTKGHVVDGVMMVHELGFYDGYDKVHYCNSVAINGPATAKVDITNPFNGDCGEMVSAWMETDAEIVLVDRYGVKHVLPAKETPKAPKSEKATKTVKIVGGSLEIQEQ